MFCLGKFNIEDSVQTDFATDWGLLESAERVEIFLKVYAKKREHERSRLDGDRRNLKTRKDETWQDHIARAEALRLRLACLVKLLT